VQHLTMHQQIKQQNANQQDGNMKQFKIIDPSGRTENAKHNTIKEVVADLLSNKRDLSTQNYYVVCLFDDIEIEADELIAAWKEGERPEDLQMF